MNAISKDEAIKELKAVGAEFARRENAHGETKSGWWLDGVYLGKDAASAIEALRG
jgi:hypothetical protein